VSRGESFKDQGTLNLVKSQGSRATLWWFNENESAAGYKAVAPVRKKRDTGRKTFQAKYMS